MEEQHEHHRRIASQPELAPEGRARFDFVFEKTLAIKREFGFSPMGIDIGLALVGTDRGYLEELRSRLAEQEMVASVGVGAIALSNDAWVRQRSVEGFRRNLEAAALLGTRVATFGCGRNGRVTRAGHLAIAVELLTEVGRAAGALGLRICQEDFDYFTSAELIHLSVATGLDNVGIQSDTGNWLILGEDPVEATRACLPYTFHTHVRDYVFENNTYNGVALGAGLVDFERVLPLLAQLGERDDIIFSIEVDTDDRDEDQCAHDSYAYIKDWLIRNGHTATIRQ